MESNIPQRRPLLGLRPCPLSCRAPPYTCSDQRRDLRCCWRCGRNIRAITVQEKAAGYIKPHKPVRQIILLLWLIHLPVYDAFSRAAAPEAVLVLLADGGDGWRLGKWNSCKGRGGHRSCSVESCDSEGSTDYWDGDCYAGDNLCGIPAIQSFHT